MKYIKNLYNLPTDFVSKLLVKLYINRFVKIENFYLSIKRTLSSLELRRLFILTLDIPSAIQF